MGGMHDAKFGLRWLMARNTSVQCAVNACINCALLLKVETPTQGASQRKDFRPACTEAKGDYHVYSFRACTES